MTGIDLDKPILFKHASLRYFSENEHHVTRFCEDDVLLLVFDGILRFSEDGVDYEVHSGEYHIQKHNTFQKGEAASTLPKYLYVHFLAEWEQDASFPFYGSFDYEKTKNLIKELDFLSHTQSTLTEKTSAFYKLLLLIKPKLKPQSLAVQIAEFIKSVSPDKLSLDLLCKEFNFSKNHIINIFKKEFGITPVKYINTVKLNHAKYLLESTSEPTEKIASESGFNDYSHFYKQFHRENGISPSAWRNEKQLRPTLQKNIIRLDLI